jgi:hypothetical protein
VFYWFPCYALADFHHNVLCPLLGVSEHFIKNSGNFIQLLKSVNFHSLNTLVSFDVVGLFTNVPVGEDPQVVSNKVHNDDTSAEWSVLQVEAIMELLEFF